MPNLNGFDAETVPPVERNYDPIPAGKYLAIIRDSAEKTSKQGHTYLNLEFEVLDGQYRGRKVWVNLNLNHPDPEVVKYARAELADICKAVGVLKPADSVQLHNLPLVITVKVQARKDTGELQNRVRGYARKEAAAGQPQQAPAASTTPPWRRAG
jgi:hypothetical protein